jgi:hypothetical protein
VRRFLLVTGLLVTFGSSSSALGSTPLTERSHDVRAWMYGRVLKHGDQIQVQVRLCERPNREIHCRLMSENLRAHIGAESRAPIRWVYRRWRNIGTYWVFSPIRFGSGRAVYRYKWLEAEAEGGCSEVGRVRFRRALDVWRMTGRSGVAVCPS